MSNKTPLIGDASGGKAATFGSIFAAYNSQVETNFNANDRPQSKISFDSDAPVSSLKQHSAYFFSTDAPTFNSEPVQGLLDLAANRNSSKSDKTTCWGKDGLQPLHHLVGYTQTSLRVKDSGLSKIFSGTMDISKTAYPDTDNSSIRDVEILFIQAQVQKLKDARFKQLLSDRSHPTFENLEFWMNSGYLLAVSREQWDALSNTQRDLLGTANTRAEPVNTWTCNTLEASFREPNRIYNASTDLITLVEKLDYISRRGIDKLIIAHPKLPFSKVLEDIVDAEFRPHQLSRGSTDAQLLTTKAFFNLTFDTQKEATALLAKQHDTEKQIRQMRIDCEALIRSSIKLSLLDDDDLERMSKFDFKNFLVNVLTKQLGQHELKKNMLEPIIDSFKYEDAKGTAFVLKDFFKSLTHLIGMDILLRIYKSTKLSDPRTHFNDFHELLSSIPLSDTDYDLKFNSLAAQHSIPRTHSAADIKDIYINSVKGSALHDKALELEKKRDTLSLDEIRLAFRDAMKDLKDKTEDKNEISVINTEQEVRKLTSRLASLEGGNYTARAAEGSLRNMTSGSGGGRGSGDNSQRPDDRGRSNHPNRDRSRSQGSEHSQHSRNPPSRDSSRGRSPSNLTRSQFVHERGYSSDSGHSQQSRASRDSRTNASRDSNHSRQQQSGGGRSAPPRYRNEAKEHDRSRSRERTPAGPDRRQNQDRGRSPARDQRQPDQRNARGNSPFPYRQPNNSTAQRNPNAQPRGYTPTRGRDYRQASPRVSFHTQNEDRRIDRDPSPRPYDPYRLNPYDGGGRTARRDNPYGNRSGQPRDNRDNRGNRRN